MVSLSRSRNIVAQSRTETLVRQISEQEWTDEVLAAIVGFFMRKSQRPVAVKYFKIGATKYGLSGGLGPLLTDMFRKRFWSGALKIWQLWYEAQSEKSLGEPSLDVLKTLSVLDTALPGLYFSFEQYLASGLSRELDAKTLESSNPAIKAFRHSFAELALQVAAPARAEVLLAFYQSPRLYHEYLERVTERWLNGEIDRETAGGLGKIYEQYRQMNDFQPSEKLLQGMFEVYYPHRLKELNILQDDWSRTRGELSPTAFNKYLKLYARLGNVAATKELVDRYHLRYPNKDKNKGLLRLMAVHARQGDVQAVRHLAQSISNDGQQHFARAAQRNLLVACVKSGAHEDAVSTFTEMIKNGLPGSADYAQMMHLYSGMGDLDKTLWYFSLAQENSVEITTGMVLAATHAFIGNDRLTDAELVVVEMAERNVTSTEIWNALIKANGEVGNLPRCYGLLSVMKERGIEYLPSTYEALLASMVRCGQIPAAVALLNDMAKNKTFLLTDEQYAIVMAGAARKGDFGTLAKLAKDAQSLSGHLSFNSQVALLSAAVRGSKSPEKAKAAALEMVQSLSDMGKSQRAALFPKKISSSLAGKPGGTKSATAVSTRGPRSVKDIVDVSPSSVRNATAQVGNAVALLVEMRDDFSIQELVSKYLELGLQKPSEPLPQSLMTSLMRAFYQDGKFRQVLNTWEKYWTQVQNQWVDPDTGLVRANKQYALVHLLRLVTKSLRELHDGEAITQFVVRVQAAGFKFSGDNCNEIVQALAELDHLETAMSWCEIMLMPNWRGWQRFPDPRVHTGETPKFLRAIKRASMDRHFVRPYQQTMLLLFEKHRKLRELASWSPENTALLQVIERENPRLLTAFARLPPQFKPRKQTKWAIDKGVSLEKRLDDFVGRMTYEEASEMKRSLKRLEISGAMEIESKVWGLLNREAAQANSGNKQQDILDALTGPFPQEDAESSDNTVSARAPRAESQVAKMQALEDKARRKLEAERERGDQIIAKRMSDWRARTWRRGRWTRWQDQWAGLGDQRNAPRS
jgi:pentatricopeptide repeat-containing protein PET309